MTGTSSEWSEEAPRADILDLDRYMLGTRPARRRQTDLDTSGLVVDSGAVGRSPSSSGSSASEPSDKRFSHDSGLSDTSYLRASRPARRNRDPTDTKYDAETRRRGNKSGSEATRQRGKNSGEARRGKSGGEARREKSGGEVRRGKSSGDARRGKSSGEARRGKTSGEAKRRKSSSDSKRGKSSSDSRRGKSSSVSRRGKSSGVSRRGKSGSEVERRTSDSRSSFRESLERTLRDQQAQIARVVQMCELQARSSPSERASERRERPSERHKRPSERRSEKRSEPPPESGRTSTYSTGFSSSSSSVDPLKRRSSECRTYKIIMSKLDELNRLFGTRRSAAAAAAARGAPARPAACEDSSVTVSDKVVGTEAPQHSARQRLAENEHNRTIIVATAAVDIPPSPRLNVVNESVVRNDREISAPASEKGMPGQFHLDDPVRLYQQAKQLEAGRRSGSSSSSRDSGRASGSGSGSSRSGRPPSLCALCRCYWLVARRYVAQLSPVKE